MSTTSSLTGRHPFEGTDVWSLVELRARVSGHRRALVWEPFDAAATEWTYAELARDAAAVAVGLHERGVTAGDRVLIHLENSPELVLSWYACAAIGAVAVTTNTRSSDAELRYFAECCDPRVVITQPRFVDRLGAAAPHAGVVLSTSHDAGVPAEVERGEHAFDTLLASDPDLLVAHPPDPRAPMSVQFTSGTTALPKAVLWTHANALWGARTNAQHEGLVPDDHYLCYLPLFHTNALSYSMLGSLWVGCDLVLVPKWSTSRFWDISHRHGCTITNLITLSARTISQLPYPESNPYRAFCMGVSDLGWDRRLGIKSLGVWGMTETISHPIVGDLHTPNRRWSIGRPAAEYEVAVVRDDGTAVDHEETGRLLVRGVRGLSLFAEYLHDPSATAAAFDEHGWFDSGDLVTPHEDGHISFADRAKDMLKVGAENVAASEVERVIVAVDGVTEAAVVGRRHDHLDEVPVVFVVGAAEDPTLAERVLEECREQLADFKVPRQVYLVAELPRSTLDKVNKGQLREVANGDVDSRDAERSWITARATDPSGDESDG